MAKQKRSLIKEGSKGVKITTPVFRMSFPKLANAEAFQEGAKKNFSLTMLFDKKQDLAKMKAGIVQAANEAFGGKAKWPKGLSLPWRDGDEKEDFDGYAGHYYCSAKTQQRPVCIDRDKTKIEVDEIEEKLYGGCYARAVVIAKAVQSGSDYFITLYLQGVQFVRDGERFGGGVNVDEDFDELEELEDDANDPDNYEDDSDDDNDMGF